MFVYLNNKLVPENKAHISIYDHGFLYGDGVYETLRVYQGQIFLLEEHLARLDHSLQGIRLKPPLPLKKIGQAIGQTVKANQHEDAVVRLTVTRGPGPYGFDPRFCRNPTLVICSYNFKPYPLNFLNRGLTAAVVSIRRNSPLALPPHVKSISCMNGILAKIQSLDLRAQEAILLTQDGYIAEGTVSNVFVVRDQGIYTPKLEGTLLAGVTREWVCQLARKNGYHVYEKRLLARALKTADEVFLTNTTMEVMPVGRLVWAEKPSKGRKKIPTTLQKKRVGAITMNLRRIFQQSLDLRNDKLSHSLTTKLKTP